MVEGEEEACGYGMAHGCRQWPGWMCDGTISCGNRTPGVAFELPPRRPIDTPGLSDPSGSDLRVMSHDVMSVIGRDIYSGLYCGGVSFDMPYHCAGMLTLSDGITRSAVAVDLHFSTSSYNRSI